MLTNLLNKIQPQVELTGLDIGTASVKLVQLLKDKDGYTVSAAAQQDISADGDKSGPEAVAAAVKACFRKANLSSRSVVCGVCGPEVMVRGFRFPPLPDDAIEQAVRFEVQQVCPFESKEMVLDYQLVGDPESPVKQQPGKATARSGLMIACTENLLRQRKTVLSQAGAKAILMDSDALAMINCLNELDILETQGAVAIIDVGWEFTNVVIYGRDGLPFVRDLNNAGRHIVEKISSGIDVSQADVRRALAGEQTPDDVLNQILLGLNNAVRPLAMAINETLRFYSYQEKTTGVEQIYLCGGFSLLDTFTEFFSDALPIDVGLLNPFDTIKCQAGESGNELLKKFGPGLVVATGLAMRTI